MTLLFAKYSVFNGFADIYWIWLIGLLSAFWISLLFLTLSRPIKRRTLLINVIIHLFYSCGLLLFEGYSVLNLLPGIWSTLLFFLLALHIFINISRKLQEIIEKLDTRS